MAQEAEANAETDRAALELAELKNKSDQLLYSTEKMIRDLGDKVSEADKSTIEDKIATLRRVAQGDDQGEIQTAFSELEQESHKLADELYKSSEAAANASEAPSEERETAGVGAEKGGGEGDVIDAEFKEEK